MNNIENIKPLGDRVLVKLDDSAKQTESGIIIPETIDKEKPQQGKVVAVGNGRITEDGSIVSMKVSAGDTILFSKYAPDEIKIGDKEYYIISEANILAVIK